VEVVIEDRFVDIVAESDDAGARLTEAIERDMVQVRITDAFRFVVVGAPSYLERGTTLVSRQARRRSGAAGARAKGRANTRAPAGAMPGQRWAVRLALNRDTQALAPETDRA
jgi:hypothetical protein